MSFDDFLRAVSAPHRGYRFDSSTRTESESNYINELEDLLADSSYSEMEKAINFPLYTPRQNLATFLCKSEIFKRVLNVHGSVIECGVFFGGGLATWAQLSAILEPSNHQRRVIGFDTFEGFPSVSDVDTDAQEGDLAIDSRAEITRAMELFDMNRPVGHIPKIELVPGDATKTIPAYVAENPQLIVSLLYLDFDIYEPTKAALDAFLPRMPKGAVIGFDELNLRSWPGESVALLDSLELGSLRLERFPFGSTISFAQL